MITFQTIGTLATDLPELVERRIAGLPDDFIRSAEFAYIPSKEELRRAGCKQGRYRPRGWHQKDKDSVFWRPSGHHKLWAIPTQNRSQPTFWGIERVGIDNDDDQFLCYAFGGMPILVRTYQSAMRLAQYCHPLAPADLGIMHWVDLDP